MRRILLDFEDGTQKLFQVDDSGFVLDKDRLVWDEKEHGPLNVDLSKVGGYIKNGDGLTFDQSKKDIADLKEQEYADKREKFKQKQSSKKQIIKDLAQRSRDSAELTSDEIKLLLKKILELYA